MRFAKHVSGITIGLGETVSHLGPGTIYVQARKCYRADLPYKYAKGNKKRRRLWGWKR